MVCVFFVTDAECKNVVFTVVDKMNICKNTKTGEFEEKILTFIFSLVLVFLLCLCLCGHASTVGYIQYHHFLSENQI